MVAPIQVGAGIEIGGGITIGDSGVSFTISSSDFTNYSGWQNVITNGTTGWDITAQAQVGRVVYSINAAQNAGFSPSKQTEIVNFYNANGLDMNYTAYMYNATWGSGSNPVSSTVICMGFYYGNTNSCQIFLSPVYTGDNNWQTSGQDIFNNVYSAASGTYNFPITFTLIQPVISDPGNWC